MIHNFEGFFKPAGYAATEGISTLVTVRAGNQNNITHSDGNLRQNIRTSTTSSSAQLPEIPPGPRLTIGAVVSTLSSAHYYATFELCAARTDEIDRTAAVGTLRTLPELPALICWPVTSAIMGCTVVKPGALHSFAPEDQLIAWEEPLLNMNVDVAYEIDYDFARNKINVFLDGVQRCSLDYTFSEEQKGWSYRPTIVVRCYRLPPSTNYMNVFSLYGADGPQGKVKAIRLDATSDVTSSGFPAGTKFDKLTKAVGVVTTDDARVEFGIADLPAGLTPLAVNVHAAVSSTHKSAVSTSLEIQQSVNGDVASYPIIPIPGLYEGHVHTVTELQKQPNGQPWTVPAINALTIGMSMDVTDPFPAEGD